MYQNHTINGESKTKHINAYYREQRDRLEAQKQEERDKQVTSIYHTFALSNIAPKRCSKTNLQKRSRRYSLDFQH